MTIPRLLLATGLRSGHLKAASMASVNLCVGLWIRAKTVDQSQREHAENRALFSGLWALTLWLISDSVAEEE
jgi:hypothetical protein